MLSDVQAVVFDLDGTLLDRHRSFERFVGDQWLRFARFLKAVERELYVQTLIAADCDGYAPRKELFTGIVAQFELPSALAETLLALLVVCPNEQWIMASFQLSPSPDAKRLVMGLRAVAVFGLAGIPLNYSVLQKLLAIVQTVRAGDPFVAANARRLHAIAWALAALQLLSLVIGAIGKSVSSPAHPVHLDAGFSIHGWVAVILTFLLARVFAEGTRMREDLAGTV